MLHIEKKNHRSDDQYISIFYLRTAIKNKKCNKEYDGLSGLKGLALVKLFNTKNIKMKKFYTYLQTEFDL